MPEKTKEYWTDGNWIIPFGAIQMMDRTRVYFKDDSYVIAGIEDLRIAYLNWLDSF